MTEAVENAIEIKPNPNIRILGAYSILIYLIIQKLEFEIFESLWQLCMEYRIESRLSELHFYIQCYPVLTRHFIKIDLLYDRLPALVHWKYVLKLLPCRFQ